MTEDALFWAFSTVAQTLGGAVALLAAFALYRLQGSRSSIRHLGEQIRDRFAEKRKKIAADRHVAATEEKTGIVDLNRPFAKKDWREFVSEAKRCVRQVGPLEESFVYWLGKECDRQDVLIPWLWSALVPSAVCIVASLVLLPFAEPLASTCAGNWLLGVVLALAAICVVLYLVFIRKALADPRLDNPPQDERT